MERVVLAFRAVETDVSSLKLDLYEAASMAEDVPEACIDHFYDDNQQAYGMTKIGTWGTFQHPDQQIPKQGSAGVPALDNEVRIVEPDADPDMEVQWGRLVKFSIPAPIPCASIGSARRRRGIPPRGRCERMILQRGVLHRDEDGFLWVVEKKDDMIITCGKSLPNRS